MATEAEITRLMNNAQVRLPGATVAALQNELFMVMDEFFKASNVWNEDITVTIPGNDPAGTVYQLVPDAPSLIDKLLWVFTQPSAQGALRGDPVAAGMSIPGELVLVNQPDTATTVIATVALTVADPVDRSGYVTFPLWVIQKYNHVILDGLLARMMTQSNKPFSNSQMGVYHMRRWEGGKAAARVEWTRSNTYRQQAWRFPNAFSHGSQKGRSSNWAPPQ